MAPVVSIWVHAITQVDSVYSSHAPCLWLHEGIILSSLLCALHPSIILNFFFISFHLLSTFWSSGLCRNILSSCSTKLMSPITVRFLISFLFPNSSPRSDKNFIFSFSVFGKYTSRMFILSRQLCKD